MPALTLRARVTLAIALWAVAGSPGPSLRSGRLSAQQRPDPSLVSVERIYASRDFFGSSFGPTRWLDDSTYTEVAPAAGGKGDELVRTDAATGRRSVLVS